MNIKFFILGLFVLVTILQISSAQGPYYEEGAHAFGHHGRVAVAGHVGVPHQVQTQIQQTSYMVPMMAGMAVGPGARALPSWVGYIPTIVGGSWRLWRRCSFIFFHPVRTIQHWLHPIINCLHMVPWGLGHMYRGVRYVWFAPFRVTRFFFRQGAHMFRRVFVRPIVGFRCLFVRFFHAMLVPLNITRHFLYELYLVILIPLRTMRGVLQELFINVILGSIRYTKTLIYELITFPWSSHYAHMFPSIGFHNNYVHPARPLCRGRIC